MVLDIILLMALICSNFYSRCDSEKKSKIEGWRNAVGEKMVNYISASATNRGKANSHTNRKSFKKQDEKSMGITVVTYTRFV